MKLAYESLQSNEWEQANRFNRFVSFVPFVGKQRVVHV